MRSVVLLPLLIACGSEPRIAPTFELGETAPAWTAAPMPSDALIGPDGRLEPIRGLEAIAPENAALLRSLLTRLDGFGLRPLIELPIAGGIDPASLPERTSGLGDAVF